MNIEKDERKWKVQLILDNEDCPYLYFPANFYGCKYGDENHSKDQRCNYDTCPFSEGGAK
jgi:hypothetical protein